MKIILHSDDINLLSYWEKSLNKECSVFDNLDDLKKTSNSIIIINYSAFNSTQEEFIQVLSARSNFVLVLHRTPNIEIAKKVLSYGAKGYGNALMKAHFLLSAIDTIKEDMIWLHPEFTSMLISQIPIKQGKDIYLALEKLSEREQEVALLLKGGDTYKVVGEKLKITPRTVKAHAQSIYSKLHVKDRLALALLLK